MMIFNKFNNNFNISLAHQYHSAEWLQYHAKIFIQNTEIYKFITQEKKKKKRQK